MKYDLLLYDVTSTYFEGECKGNPLARRGYSRDSRPDCLQVCIGLVVTTDGIPLGYEVFSGNTNDSRTVQAIVEAMEQKYGRADRIWVMDRGMVSQENLRFLRERGGSYIVGTPKAMLRQFERYLTDQDWQKMQASADSGRLKDPGIANRRLGRLQGQYWRAAGAFDVKIAPWARPKGKARLSITWTRNGRWSDWAALSEGCYLLRTNLTDTDPAVLWKRYIQLTVRPPAAVCRGSG